MGDKINLTIDPRTVHGKKLIQIRRAGLVPTIVYGQGVEPLQGQVVHNVLEKVVREAGKHTPVHITVAGKKHIAMIKDVDQAPVSGILRHVAFHAVNQNEPVVAIVPIHLVGEGESDAERAGLVVLQAVDQIEVRALPLDLPEALEVSIAHLKSAGEQITLGDVTLPKNVSLVEHTSGHEEEDDEAPKLTDLVLVSVYEPAALEAANEAAAGDATIDTKVEADNGSDTPQDTQAEESKPGGKLQDEPKQSNVDANKN